MEVVALAIQLYSILNLHLETSLCIYTARSQLVINNDK